MDYGYKTSPRHSSLRRALLVGAASFLVTLFVGLAVGWVVDRLDGPPAPSAPAREGAAPRTPPALSSVRNRIREPAPEPSALASLGLPTPRTDLFDEAITNAFVATNERIPETALHGSARTGSDGRARFHKGIDIAPVLPRTRSGEATDPVFAVADGTVLYANRVAGNSSYGAYVVLLHDDPVQGVYTLYAHLSSLESAVRKGASVRKGDVLGVMGRSANSPIPKVRAHLHFEIGLLLNRRFERWERETKQTPLRGNGHGWNLLAADSRDVLRTALQRTGSFSMLSYLRDRTPACTLALHVDRLPDYFALHAPLWQGPDVPEGGADIVLGVSDAGLILSGRMATAEESAALATLPARGTRVAVLSTDEDLLGRNGMRLVVKDRGRWRFGDGQAARRWLDILRR